MMTRTDNIVLNGIKENSMYQPNAVTCDATIKEMNQYYEKISAMQSEPQGEENKMEILDVTPRINYHKIKSLIKF